LGRAGGIHFQEDRAEGESYVCGEERDLSGAGVLYRVPGSGVDGCGASQCLAVQPVVEPLHPLPYSFYCHHRRCLPEAAGVARRGTKLAGRKKFFSGSRCLTLNPKSLGRLLFLWI